MKNENLNNEIDELKSKSIFKIKMTICIYKLYRMINGRNFYFAASLIPVLLFSYLINLSLLTGLVTHFVSWVLLNKLILDDNDLEDEKEELTLIINELESFIKEKKV